MRFVVTEVETEALRRAVDGLELTTSELSVTEVSRGAMRRGEEGLAAARRALGTVGLVSIDSTILEAAADLRPETLRTLDAIHLATALALGKDCEGMITYDTRMADTARELGLRVEAPGQAATS